MIKLYKPPKKFYAYASLVVQHKRQCLFCSIGGSSGHQSRQDPNPDASSSSDGHKARLATQTLQIFQRETSETEPDRQTVVYIDR